MDIGWGNPWTQHVLHGISAETRRGQCGDETPQVTHVQREYAACQTMHLRLSTVTSHGNISQLSATDLISSQRTCITHVATRNSHVQYAMRL